MSLSSTEEKLKCWYLEQPWWLLEMNHCWMPYIRIVLIGMIQLSRTTWVCLQFLGVMLMTSANWTDCSCRVNLFKYQTHRILFKSWPSFHVLFLRWIKWKEKVCEPVEITWFSALMVQKISSFIKSRINREVGTTVICFPSLMTIWYLFLSF